MEKKDRQHAEQKAVLIAQVKTGVVEMKHLIEAAHDGAKGSYTPVASFQPLDSSSDGTFLTANSTPKEKEAQVFLTNQTTIIYKLLLQRRSCLNFL